MEDKKRRYLGYLMVGLTTAQPFLPLFASSQRVHIKGNVPIVDITKPNSQGISHNKYADFNVNASGLVLNNSTVAGNSQLAGALEKNANLSNQSAKLIINEVTGGKESVLNGKIEVFGPKSDVMIANTKGITCDGCGFINTSKATLTTGKLDVGWFNGKLNKIEVREGAVTIGENGMDGMGADYVEILSRATNLNGVLKANDLSLVQGANRIDYENNEIKDIGGPVEFFNRPTVAIDTKALGGMYAGRIRLMTTENGLNVNLNNITSTKNEININVAGDISLGNTQAKGDLLVQGNNIAIKKGANVASGLDMHLVTEKLINNGNLDSQKDMSLFANKMENNYGLIRAKDNMWIQKDLRGNRGESLVNKAGRILTEQGDLIIRHDKVTSMGDYSRIFETANWYSSTKEMDDYLGISYAFDKYGFLANPVAYYANISMFDAMTWFGRIDLKKDDTINTNIKEYKLKQGITSADIDNAMAAISSGKSLYINSNTFEQNFATTSAKQDAILTGGSLTVTNHYTGAAKEYKQFIPKYEQIILNNTKGSLYDYSTGVLEKLGVEKVIPIALQNELKALSVEALYNHYLLLMFKKNRANFDPKQNLVSNKLSFNVKDAFKTWQHDKAYLSSITAGRNLVLDYKNDIKVGAHNFNHKNYKEIMASPSRVPSAPMFYGKQNLVINANNLFAQEDIGSAGKTSITVNNDIDIYKAYLSGTAGLNLIAGNNIRLLQSNINAGNLSIISRNGTIQIETPTDTRYATANGQRLGGIFVHQKGDLQAGKDIILKNITLGARNDFSVIAGQNVIFSDTDDLLEPAVNKYKQNYATRYQRTVSMLSSLRQGLEVYDMINKTPTSILFQAGKDLDIRGKSLGATSVSLIAGNNIFMGTRKTSALIKDTYFPNSFDEILFTSYRGQKNLFIHAGGNIDTLATRFYSSGDIVMLAGGNLNLNAIQRTKTDANNDNNYVINYVAPIFTASGNLFIDIGGKLTTHAGRFKSGNAMTIASGGDANFLSILHEDYSEFNGGYRYARDPETSILESGGALSILSNAAILFQASVLSSNRVMDIAAKGGVLFAQAMLQDSVYEKKTVKRKWYRKKTTILETQNTKSYRPVYFHSAQDVFLTSMGDGIYEASQIRAGKNVKVESKTGRVILKGMQERDFSQKITNSRGLFITNKNKGHDNQTWLLPQIQFGGKLTIDGKQGVVVDIKREKNQTLAAVLNALSGQQGDEWYSYLKNSNNVSWNMVEDVYKSWDEKKSRLHPVAGAIITVAIGAVTQGWGLEFGKWLSGFAGNSALTPSISAVGTAGMMSLSSQAALALINNQGDLTKAYKELTSSQTVKSIVNAIVVSGALAGFDQLLATPSTPGLNKLPVLTDKDWVKTASRLTGQSVISAGSSAAILGGSFKEQLANALLSNVTTQLHAEGANLIGDLSMAGKLDPTGKALSHAVLAGMLAEVGGGSGKGAAAGSLAAAAAGIALGDRFISNHVDFEKQIAIEKIVGAIAGALATGSVEGVNSGANAAEIIAKYNDALHDLQDRIDERKILEWMFDGDQEKVDAFRFGKLKGRGAGVIAGFSSTIDAILHPVDTVLGLWDIVTHPGEYYDKVTLSFDEWELAVVYALETDPALAGEMISYMEGYTMSTLGVGFLLGGAGITVAGKFGKSVQKVVKTKFADKWTTNGYIQLANGKWFDSEGLPLPVPPGIGASGRVPIVLQSGGNTINQSTASGLNKFLGGNTHRREWGRALERLKEDYRLSPNHHGRILDNGDYIGINGEIIGNIGDYLK